MADNDYVDEYFLYLLEKDADELEAAGRNQNCRSDEVEHANPETGQHGIQVNSSIESEGNFSTSSFSRETRVASFLETPLSFQCNETNFDISTSETIAGAQQSHSKTTEENPANSFLLPVIASRGDIRRTEDSQSNLSEHSSSQHNIGRSNLGQLPWKRVRHASFGSSFLLPVVASRGDIRRTEDSQSNPSEHSSSQHNIGRSNLGQLPWKRVRHASFGSCRKKENKRAELFPQRKPNPPVSASPPQISIERDRNETVAQTKGGCREVSITSSIFPQIDDISNIEEATDSVSLGPVADAEAKAVSAGGESGIQTRSDQTGKEKPFKCGICGKTFGRKDHLLRHENTHAGNKSFVCSSCGKAFGRKDHLLLHENTHTGNKSFVCSSCGKTFGRIDHLLQHENTHTGNKSFVCSSCGKAFGRKYHLLQHENTHTGNKSFVCSSCGKGFTQRGDLRKHLLVHSGEKPHECTECPKRFRQKSHLVTHLRTHTKEKTFTCDMCDMKLGHKSTFRAHLRRHTGQGTHQCEVCRRDFASKTNCIEHQRTEHGWK